MSYSVPNTATSNIAGGDRRDLLSPTTALLALLGFLLVVILRPADFVPVMGKLRPAVLMFTVAILAWVLAGRRTRLFVHRTNKYAALLLLLMIATVPFSYWPSKSLETTIVYAKMLVAFFLICNVVKDVRALRIFILALVGALTVHAVLVIRAYLLGNLHHDRVEIHADGAFGDPNDIAMGLVMMLPLTIWLKSRWGTFGKAACWCLFVVLLMGIAATQSRGGFLGAITCAILLIRQSRHKLLALVVAWAVGAVLIILLPASTFERVQTMSEYQQEESAQSRLYVWKTGVRMFADHPLTGVGAGAFGIAYGEDYINASAPVRKWLTAHNSLIQVSAELGIAGGLLWLCMIFSGFGALKELARLTSRMREVDRVAADLYSIAQYLRMSLIGYVVCALFLSRAYDWLLMIVLSLSIASLLIAQSRYARGPQRFVFSRRPTTSQTPTMLCLRTSKIMFRRGRNCTVHKTVATLGKAQCFTR